MPRRHDPCIRGVGDRTKRRSAQRQHLESKGKHRQSCQCKQSMPARARHTRCGIGSLRTCGLPLHPRVQCCGACLMWPMDLPRAAARVTLLNARIADVWPWRRGNMRSPPPGCTGATRTSGRCAHSSGDGRSPFMELLTVRRLNAWQGLRNLRRVEPCAHRLIWPRRSSRRSPMSRPIPSCCRARSRTGAIGTTPRTGCPPKRRMLRHLRHGPSPHQAMWAPSNSYVSV